MKTKKLLLNALPLLLIGTAMVYAAAPSGGYLPGTTTDPACAPGDTDCKVQVPADTDDQTLSLTGTNLSIQDGNTVDLSGLSGTNIWSQSGATTYYNNGNVGIGTSNPTAILDIEVPDTFTGALIEGGSKVNVSVIPGPQSIALSPGSKSTGNMSVAIGQNAIASGPVAVAIGNRAESTGYLSLALGNSTEASGSYAIAIGSSPEASGNNSMALGTSTKAIGTYSTSFGFYTTATSDYTTAFGKYNVGLSSALVEIGNGTSTSNKSNALTILNSGKIGIGVDNPYAKLSIESGGAKQILIGEGGKGPYIGFAKNNGLTLNAYIQHRDSSLSASDLPDSFGLIAEGTTDLWLGTTGTAKLFIDSANGNIGIRTTSPKRSLHILGDVNSAAEIRLESNSSATKGSGSHFVGYRSRGTQLAPTEPLEDDMLATFQGRSAVSPYSYAGMRIYAAEDFTATEQGSYVGFHSTDIGAIGSSERMRIASNGDVGIGTISPTAKLDVRGSITASLPGSQIVAYPGGNPAKPDFTWGGQGTTTGMFLPSNGNIGFSTSGTERVRISSTGNVGIGRTNPSYKLHVNGSVAGVGAYVNTSDRRLKQDFEDLENPLEKLLKIKGLTFDWKRDENPEMDFPQGRDLGVVAQDVEKVFPEAVVQDDDGIFSVAYSKLIAPIIEAIRELVFENERQDAEIETLKNENTQLKERLLEVERYISENSGI